MSAAPSSTEPGRNALGKSSAGEFEVLPPEQHHSFDNLPKDKALAWLIQYVMDNLLRVPGTKARIGLTPFLDLLPVVGDGMAVVVSALTIIEGARRRVPKIVLARMGTNVLLNGLIGTLPVVGEAFSFWFKPSYRNYLLLQKHSATDEPGGVRSATSRDWIFVVGLLAVLFVIVGLFIGIGAYISWKAIQMIGHSW